MRAREFEEMDEARKEQERDRLHDLVFDGAPDYVEYAMQEPDGGWFTGGMKPDRKRMGWRYDFTRCKNQPETELDWTDTLIRRQS
jgi:Cys-tRNA synthase (O-phospho-L-seryl-tRNA:Cys-tRNA synthase)